jgi:phosphinothricin acetyltransferase
VTASPADAGDILRLVAGSGLPTDGLAEQIARVLIHRGSDGHVDACALIESYPPYGLLRSVAVGASFRSSGAGTAVVSSVIRRARDAGLAELFLLTETAPAFFARLGFQPVARARVPGAVQASPEFRTLCPASALVMARPVVPSVPEAGLSARPAIGDDIGTIASIYNEGIEDRLGTFETRPRAVTDVKGWFDGRYPVVVVERDEDDGRRRVVAFASTSRYRARDCYAGIAEFSVYAARADRGRGCGRVAMRALIEAAERAGFWKLLSRVFVENAASRRLLAGHGFREVGIYERHGQLDGVWRDVVITERLLGDARG